MSSPDDLMPEALRLRRRAARLAWLVSNHQNSDCGYCKQGPCAELRYLMQKARDAADMAGGPKVVL